MDKRFQKILVPVRSPDAAGYTTRIAIDLAQRLHGEIFLILENIDQSASSEKKYFWLMAEDEDASRSATTHSSALKSKFSGVDELGIPVHKAHIGAQPIASGIVEYAANNAIDLIVMESYRHRSMGRLVFGGTVGEIVRWSKCPVLTVRKQSPASSDFTVQRILVPVDFSVYSPDALRLANTLAGLYDASIQLLYIHEERPQPVFSNSGSSDTTVPQSREDRNELARNALESLFEKDGNESVPVSYHVRRGQVSKEILDFSVGKESDLIIISSHGLTNNPDFTLGSVAEKVIRRARCPVLVLKGSHTPILAPGNESGSIYE